MNHYVLKSTNKILRTCKLFRNFFQNSYSTNPYTQPRSCGISKNDDCKQGPSIVIIGAGVAGLSAAERLITAGIPDVIVLEATDRPGGRIHSCRLASAVAELGAQWIFDSSISNNITTLAAQEGLLDLDCVQKLSKGTLPSPININVENEGKIISNSVALKAVSIYKEIEQKAYGLSQLCTDQDHGSLMNYMTLSIEQELQNFIPSQREDAARIMYGHTNALKNRWGSDLENISADLFGNFTVSGGETVGLPSGFVSVLAPLLRGIPSERVLYKKVVKSVLYACPCTDGEEPAGRAKVTCCDQSCYCCDYVITTVSLGVLKAMGEILFCPRLPEEKLNAIKKLGYGNTEKIYLLYETPFWVCKQGTINVAWSAADLQNKDNWTTGIGSIDEVPTSNQVLHVSVSGKQADRLEKRNDIQVSEDLTRIMRQLTGNPSLPYPSSVLRSRWKASPHFLGSNSFLSTDSSVGQQCDLAAPVLPEGSDSSDPPVLFFAGEATCKNFYSTVQGARKSGFTAAQDIIDLTKKYGGPPPA